MRNPRHEVSVLGDEPNFAHPSVIGKVKGVNPLGIKGNKCQRAWLLN